MAAKLDDMIAVYVLIIYVLIYTIFGFMCSFISEYVSREKHSTLSSYCAKWIKGLSQWKTYYFAFALHVFDEATTISSVICMYCICQDRSGTDINDWKILTRQAKPCMILVLSVIIYSLYKLTSIIYIVSIDIFSWFQVPLHVIDCNYLYEIFIAHTDKNKNPVIQWMHRQYVYLCSIPLWFLQFVLLMRFGDVLPSTPFICILLSVLFGFMNIFYVILWCDMNSFSSECKEWYERGFRLRFAFRLCQYISRMIWFSYFWIFLGSAPFFILLLILFLNNIYLYFCGYFIEFYYIISSLFVIPDLSTGIGRVNSNNHGLVSWFQRILYVFTHCGGCMIGIWIIIGEDIVYVDMLCWLHWFENLLFWAIITGICDNGNGFIFGVQYNSLWNDIFISPKYAVLYAFGIITWFFGGAYYLVIRCEEFIDRNKQSVSISQGILGLAQRGEWDSLNKLLLRMNNTSSVNRCNIADNNKSAMHYAIQQNKWSVVDKLLSYGANVNIKDKTHQTAVHLICINRELHDMKLFSRFLLLFDSDPITKRDNNGQTILHLICSNGSDRLPLKQRLTFYMERFAKNSKEFDVNIADNNGCTPLHYIVQQTNDIECIQILINNGAQIDINDNKKQSPLIYCVLKDCNPTTLRYLLSKGANINHQDDKGWTPIHFAANSNLTDNLYILLEHFPNITIRNNAGKNAYNLANSMGYNTIADTLKMNMPSNELCDHQTKLVEEDIQLVIQDKKEENKVETDSNILSKPKYEEIKSVSVISVDKYHD